MRGRLLAAVALVAISSAAFAQTRTPRHRATRHAAPVATVPTPPTATVMQRVSRPVPTQMEPVVPAGPPQSLRGALVRTYASNPTLMAQRQSLRGTDESVDI